MLGFHLLKAHAKRCGFKVSLFGFFYESRIGFFFSEAWNKLRAVRINSNGFQGLVFSVRAILFGEHHTRDYEDSSDH